MAIDREKWARKIITIARDVDAQVSRYRYGNAISSESEAIRRLIKAGLDAENAKASHAAA